jgi:SAM-dependent methyltransferase
MLAQLEPGQVVLDLGSGAGLDVLLSARRVSPGGHAYGVDMTDEMLELANRNKEKSGLSNVTFLKGAIENIPLPDASVDVVISNCVINLAEDKGAVIKEAFRVLRPGGLFAVADMVELETLDLSVKRNLDALVGCISGTIPIEQYRNELIQAGFRMPSSMFIRPRPCPTFRARSAARISALASRSDQVELFWAPPARKPAAFDPKRSLHDPNLVGLDEGLQVAHDFRRLILQRLEELSMCGR